MSYLFYCGPAFGLGTVNALTSTDFLLVNLFILAGRRHPFTVALILLFLTFLHSGLVSALICDGLGRADTDTRYPLLWTCNVDMRG